VEIPEVWKDPITGIKVPKRLETNVRWRIELLKKAENDDGMQKDLMAACSVSQLLWVNAFCQTYHQFDVAPDGRRVESKYPHQPMITWPIQDELLLAFEDCVKTGTDILIDKSRDMGASWCCIDYLHWLWLFQKDKELLELSRVKDYVDKVGNMKALFQKHDYLNSWLPGWMLPPSCLPDQKNRTVMRLHNELTGSTISGESTTPHAARGGRFFVGLLDEFAAVENGSEMRRASRDACLVRIVNSTVGGPGTEYSKWKNSGQIKVFVMPFWEHPDKGAGRYVKYNEETKVSEIRSPWLDAEEKVRSAKELASEVHRQDIESGDLFFTNRNVDKYAFINARPPDGIYDIRLKHEVKQLGSEHVNPIERALQQRLFNLAEVHKGKGPLKWWGKLLNNRPDQTRSYIFGIDTGKGVGASNSVVSIKCKETGEKVGEWADANVPPYEFAPIVAALALWVGGCQPRRLPFLKWENNGPGWDLGRILVKDYKYPYYYRVHKLGKVIDEKTQQYGWQNNRQSKKELLGRYDEAIAHGGYINHSLDALMEMKSYVYFDDGSIGPASLVEDSSGARKSHGDRVMADALTIEDSEIPKSKPMGKPFCPENSFGGRMEKALGKRKPDKSYKTRFDFNKVA
jgi:hypothetical protein